MPRGPQIKNGLSNFNDPGLRETCSVCGQSYPSIDQLRNHVRNSHSGLPGTLKEDGLIANLPSLISDNQLHPSNIKKALAGTRDEASIRSSEDDNNSMRTNLGEDSQSQSTNSKPVSTQSPIRRFNSLSLNHAIANSESGQGQSPSIPVNPLKRPARDLGNHDIEQASVRPRNSLSGSHLNYTKDSDTKRNPAGSKKSENAKKERTQSRAQQGETTQTYGKPSIPSASSDKSGDAPSVANKNNVQPTEQLVTRKPHEETCLLQAECRPIPLEQLIVEVKGIYAGLVMVEAKCIDVDDKQIIAAQEKDPAKRPNLTPEQWSALQALHRTLLHEHHDFFLASQHPVASPAVSKLAAKYSMAARMWRHGIHGFLEVLRYRLPESLDQMRSFIYIAFSMIALLLETVPAFVDTWTECLGDLGRYRMAIEDEDLREREVWSGIARFWYRKSADKSPKIGRLQHHLAILARPYTISQLNYYTRSLTCITPFESSRGSIMTLFVPVIENHEFVLQRSNTMEITFTKAHALLFTGQNSQGFGLLVYKLTEDHLLEQYITRAGSKFKEVGVSAAQANIAAVLGYGAVNEKGKMRAIIYMLLEQEYQRLQGETLSSAENSLDTNSSEETRTEDLMQKLQNSTDAERLTADHFLRDAKHIFYGTLSVALRRKTDRHVFPMIYIYLVFIWHISNIAEVMDLIEDAIPWTNLISFLNALTQLNTTKSKPLNTSFPSIPSRPLPEDYSLRGQFYSETWFPLNWFEDAGLDDEERALELPSMHAPRVDRILCASQRIASHGKWMTFDSGCNRFSETEYVAELTRQCPTRPWIVDPIANQEDIPMSGMERTQDSIKEESNGHKKSAANAIIPETERQFHKTQPSQNVRVDVDAISSQKGEGPKEVKREYSAPPIHGSDNSRAEWFNRISDEHKSPTTVEANGFETKPGKPVIFRVLDETKDPTSQ